MEHFSVEKWIDFVNQAVTTNEQQQMDRHLSLGCEPCQETVSLWQRVRSSAAAEGNYQPPESAVRIAKTAYASAGLAAPKTGPKSKATLLFTTFLHPPLAAARSS